MGPHGPHHTSLRQRTLAQRNPYRTSLRPPGRNASHLRLRQRCEYYHAFSVLTNGDVPCDVRQLDHIEIPWARWLQGAVDARWVVVVVVVSSLLGRQRSAPPMGLHGVSMGPHAVLRGPHGIPTRSP